MGRSIVKKQLRILLFAEPESAPRPDFGTLSQFAVVRRVNWRYRPIHDNTRYVFIKIPYRAIEGFFWIVKLLIEIQRFQADIVVARYAHFCGLIGAIAARLSGKKAIVRAVGSDLKVHSTSFIGRIVILLTLRIASGAICVSKDLENIAKGLGARSTKVIPDALDLPKYIETSTPKNDREVITVARLVPVKGLSYLIRAMTHIKDGTLVVIGDGPEKTKLESLSENLGLSDRVSFTGWISNRSRLSQYLKRATVFVLSSLSEGTPQAIIEAMSYGLPIVATNVGGIPEIVVDGVNGFLVPPRNEQALAEAIEKALSDTNLQRRASSKNREVAKRFLLPTVAQSTYNYFREIAMDQRYQ